ncbi:MAG: hypothetical protein M3347_15890 [Armatimonadota bacterium]|nr:hypothetical protein [Armatimonadota bacterium]
MDINNSTLDHNAAVASGNLGGNGGGIANFYSDQTHAFLVISNSTLSSNSANGDLGGGGIFNGGNRAELGGPAFLTIHNSTLSGNSASGNLGAAAAFATTDMSGSAIRSSPMPAAATSSARTSTARPMGSLHSVTT